MASPIENPRQQSSPESPQVNRPLHPELPYRMTSHVGSHLQDPQRREFVGRATSLKFDSREQSCRQAFGQHYDSVRALAGVIKQHTLDHLDHYLEQFIGHATQNGIELHFAEDAQSANEICRRIATSAGCTACVKSKSMATEETDLLRSLEAAGIETLETDLGEFIVQLDDDAPSHIVTPMIHKDRRSVARAFVRELGADYTEDPVALTQLAREYMRKQYRRADLGVSGANFLVADSGGVVVCTNEGNADFVMSGSRVHVIFAGIEKLIPRTEDLSVYLKLLSRSATGQPLTVYNSLVFGPKRKQDVDGPEEVHLIFIDNGRIEGLAEETRDLLRCIRCGACLNACPVYRHVGGGHAYGSVYSGPIGAVLTPLLKGLENYPDTAEASSLCGSCYQVCAVSIDIPKHLVRWRQRRQDQRLAGPFERWSLRIWAWWLKSSLRYRWATSVMRWSRALLGQQRWLRWRSWPLGKLGAQRDLPLPAPQSFRHWWSDRSERGARSEEPSRE